jgi:hypothetical protein
MNVSTKIMTKTASIYFPFARCQVSPGIQYLGVTNKIECTMKLTLSIMALCKDTFFLFPW